MAAAAMAVILYRQRTLVVPRGFAIWLLFLVWMLAGVFVVRAIAPGTVPGVGIGRLRRLPGVGRLVLRHHRRDALRRQHRPAGAHPEDRPPAGLDVRGHHRVRGARRPGPHPGVQVGDGAGPAQGPDVEQLRPHPGAPVAVVHERLPRLRAGLDRRPRSRTPTPGATTWRCTCRSSSWPGSAATPAGAGRWHRSCWWRPWSPSRSRSTADCGARSRWRPGTPPSGSR